MFRRTKIRLTVMYSAMIALLLLTMVGIIYLELQQVVRTNEQLELQMLAERSIRFWQQVEVERGEEGEEEEERREVLEYQEANTLVMREEGARRILSLLERHQFLLIYNPEGGPGGTFPFKIGHDAALLAGMAEEVRAWRPEERKMNWIIKGEQAYAVLALPLIFREVGTEETEEERAEGWTIFAGEEVSGLQDLMEQMEHRFFLLAVLLLFLATGLGFFFSGRAMVPVQKAYYRQQAFVADASHELRTPLSILQSSVEVLEEEKERLSSYYRHVLEDMKEEIRHMSRMSEDLLTLARVDADKLDLDWQPVDLGQLAAESIQRMKLLARKKEIKLSFRGPGAPLEVQGDAQRLKQLLYILLDNAIKYTEPKGEVRVQLYSSGREAVLEVVDTGVGISEEELSLIFERFYRVDKARTRQTGGTGLGLSIAKWIAEAHGGRIIVQSKPRKGSCFTVFLPQMSPSSVNGI